ncbi:MAG: branched-chain amino acid transport system substrate-binding protein [Solirubrobacteraceae bacterium]|jgi:branched-chain amino acid transport system substrate-binding protein|nr:branched-chain amino acid transport system substrate-binding protein [Solirubrobacteraceae bacterium]
MDASSTTLRRGLRLALCAAAAAAALGVAACGDDDEGSAGGGSTPAPAETQASSGTEAPAAEAKSITDFQEYVGGKAGKASGEPIPIGWINNDGGQGEIPEATRVAKATVKYINEELGGIDGRPVSLETCFIVAAEEEGQKCGQRFANDSDMKVINGGVMIIGNESYHAQIKGQKVTIFGVANSPADLTAKNVFALYGATEYVLGPMGTYARDELKAKTGAMVFNQQPGTIAIANAAKKGIVDAGIKVKLVGFDPQTTDLVGPITAAGSQTADVLLPVTDTPNCINYAKAVKSAGLESKTVLSTPLCLAPPVAEALGDLPKWTYVIAQDLPNDLGNPTVKAYTDAVTKHGAKPADAANVFSGLAFADLLATVKILNETGADASVDDVAAAFKGFKGPVIMGPPDIQCGKYPKAPAVCNDQSQFFKYEGKGKFTKVASWTRPPAAG